MPKRLLFKCSTVIPKRKNSIQVRCTVDMTLGRYGSTNEDTDIKGSKEVRKMDGKQQK